MDLPTLGEFKILLNENRAFRDYFNAFLNLPVFAKRLTYSSERRAFFIEPRVKTSYHSLNEPGVWSWVHETRLPLFWVTDMHLECRLSQSLVQSSSPVRSDLCSVAVMDRFRRFLCRTEGESVWLFWKDVERLKVTRDRRISQKVFHHIQLTYLQDGAPFLLAKCIKEEAVLCARKEQLLKTSTGVCRLELLFNAQSLALNELIMYWSLRYNVHLDNEQGLTHSSNSISRTFSRQKDCCELTATEQKIRLPSIIYDQGDAGAHQRPEKVAHIRLSTFSLPSLVSNGGCGSLGYSKEVTNTLTRKSVAPLITPSTHSLFPGWSNFTSQTTCLIRELPQLPFLFASLRADSLAGHPFLLYLTKQRSLAYNHLLFWQSVEVLLTQDEMKRWSQRQKLLSPNTGCDQVVFFDEYPMARDLGQLLALFLRSRSPHRVDLPRGLRRRELCVLLEKGLGHNLLLTAQDHSSKELFTHWQAYLLDDHHSFMSNCTSKKVMRHCLHRTLTMEHSPSPGQLIEAVFDPPMLQTAWRSLRYAEAAKYNGIHLLPSRTHPPALPLTLPTEGDEFLLDLIDVDAPISLEGMALSPMVTTICDQLLYDWKESKSKRTIICTTTHSFEGSKRPQIPMSIIEILKDREQLEFFRHFLFMHGTNAEMPLQFWMAVEDIKSSLDNKRAVSSKVRRIQERFFVGKGGSSHLSHHPVFYELSKSDTPSILQLIAAQIEVIKSIEKNWLEEYIQHLRNKEEEDTEREEERKSVCKASTKGLWGMFAHNVISFRRGLMNSATAEQFRGFLREEVIKGSTGHSPKKLIGTKVVNVIKLLNDLSFWVEVERYKDLADMIRAGKENGTHTPEDDIMVHKKAHAIINCYIDSSVSPRVQINIPNDLVGYILDNISQGLISRGLFHEAALNIFSVLILYWKKFCVYRFAPRGKEQSASVRTTPSIAPGDPHDPQPHGEEKRDWHTHYFFDGGPILSFNLTAGVQWHYPPNYHLTLQQENIVAT